ncbi:MAG: hypothetical protein ACKOPE_06100 [Novosphingobium sp.]
MGWASILLGVGGSPLAGFLTSSGGEDFYRGGCPASILGVMLLIFLGRHFGWDI